MKILTLPPAPEPKKPTVLHPAQTLGEHEEAFKSRNGYEVEPPPDTSNEISGIISEIMQLRYVTRKEIMEAGRLIKKLDMKRTTLNIAARQVYKALGYTDYHDAVARNGDTDRFENLNFHRKNLAAINQEVNDKEQVVYEAVTAHIRPYFERVFALPRESEWFSGERAITTGQFMGKLQPYLNHLGWEFENAKEAFMIAHAFAFRYPHASNLQTKKDLFRDAKLFGTRKQAFDASRRLAKELG